METGQGLNFEVGQWSFANGVAEKFEEHASLSIPGYRDGHWLIAELCEFFLGREISHICEIGSSTGLLIRRIAERHERKSGLRLTGIEIEAEMVKMAKELCTDERISIVHGNAIDIELEKADIFICYYILQFLNIIDREHVVQKIYKKLDKGNAMILFEKELGEDGLSQSIFSGCYDSFKIANGLMPNEVIGKQLSLRGVLKAQMPSQNLDLLTEAGFNNIFCVYQHMAFKGYLAIK